ncbi:hypothetical protein FJZ17_00380 [Candidatus Pacearchaeota archaeon]|nr:hypothetical protein [Candidatus Pacearchaeota archaeon]
MIERKKLLFAPPFPPTLFTGEKNKTFRVTGGERYNPGDPLSLCYVDEVEFAQAVLLAKYRKAFRQLDARDWAGHETFESPEEMFKIYSGWEGFEVGPDTSLDILVYGEFRLTGPVRSARAQSSPRGKQALVPDGPGAKDEGRWLQNDGPGEHFESDVPLDR